MFDWSCMFDSKLYLFIFLGRRLVSCGVPKLSRNWKIYWPINYFMLERSTIALEILGWTIWTWNRQRFIVENITLLTLKYLEEGTRDIFLTLMMNTMKHFFGITSKLLEANLLISKREMKRSSAAREIHSYYS